MAKKRKAKTKAKKSKAKKVAKSKKRAAPARKRKVAAKRRPAKKSAKPKPNPKRREAKTTLPPRGKAPSESRPMTQPGPAVTPIMPRSTSFPSSVPGDAPTSSPDGNN